MGKRGPKKGCGGRPTKYKPEFCKKIIEFFNKPVYEEIEIPHYKNGEITWIDKRRSPALLPTLTNFVKSLKLDYSTVYNWLNKDHKNYKENFFKSFTYAKALQKDFLIQSGLLGLYNPISFKFVAVNLTDMRDIKQEEIKYSETREIIIDIKPEVLQEKINLIKKVKDANIKRIDSQAVH